MSNSFVNFVENGTRLQNLKVVRKENQSDKIKQRYQRDKAYLKEDQLREVGYEIAKFITENPESVFLLEMNKDYVWQPHLEYQLDFSEEELRLEVNLFPVNQDINYKIKETLHKEE